MSKAREKFFEAIDFLADQMYMTIAENIVTHVTDIESKVEQLEAEKAELIEALKTTYDFNDHWGIGNYHRWGSDFQNKVEKLIQEHGGKLWQR